MYICICNCLKEQHCLNSLAAGATCALEVYEKQGCKPKCGKCIPVMQKVVEQNFFQNNQVMQTSQISQASQANATHW